MVAAATIHADDGHEPDIAPAVEGPQPNPIATLVRAMRGRWKGAFALALVLGPALAGAGYFTGFQLYESQAILRVYPQESNILYATGDDSVLKTFDSFVKAEATYVASHPVMAQAVQELTAARPDLAGTLKTSDLSGSIEIKRSDSLIVLKTRSREPAFASQKLDALIASYLALKSQAEEIRTSVRLSELRAREGELAARLSALRSDQFDVGGEFGLNALAKAHVEKIAQIDVLASRKSEVAATLVTLEANNGMSSADTSNREILRATLLDRAMADLNFERARLMSELAGMRADYSGHENLRFQRKERAKLEELAVIEKAMADRREQINLLGQTGALTDASDSGSESTLAEIKSVLEKVDVQLETARREARDLNRRRIELDRIENEIDEAETLLQETRRALEVIRLEFGRALPGYAVVMSPPSLPAEPVEDTRKILMVAGMAGGAGLAIALALGLGLAERRIRFAETLVPVGHRLSVQQVSDADDNDPHAADLLRNELQLKSLRKPRLVGIAPVIAVTRAGPGETTDFARALARSFARARMKTLFVDADIGKPPCHPAQTGWRDLLAGAAFQPGKIEDADGLWELCAGTDGLMDDHAVSALMVRGAIDRISQSFDVVIVSAGSIRERLSTQFVLSSSDVGVLALDPSDMRAAVFGQIDRLDALPRNGSVAVMRNALPGDPWLAVRT
ncbi:MAG: hypothetical protein RIE24_08905 [Silicimonas sp.]